MRRKLFHLIALIVVAASGDFSVLAARAQIAPATGRPVDYQKSGIRFQIRASIKAAPDSPYGKRDNNGSRASLDVKLRISAHATESNYFGVVSETFSNFRPNEGSEEKLFWQDGRCHQRRGLPKTTVTSIDGSIETEQGQISIAARPRHLGVLLPSDEITAGTRLPNGADKNGSFIAYRSQSKSSQLLVDVKVYVVDCELAAGALSGAPSEARPR
jgi:hypothetical protein